MEMTGGMAPILTGRRVVLRALRREDAGSLLRCWSDPETARWLGIAPPGSVREAEALISILLEMEAMQESLRWSITLREGEVIGSCGYNQWQLAGAYRGEIGCELAPSYQGMGYMREALELIVPYGFREMGLNRIEALCQPGNVRAGRLMSSLGFRREGTLREYRHTAEGYADVDMYALLQREWRGTMA